ncbi:MAG: hypothetical protein MHM6MM_005776 [Cercozoa sp. M6MM]
MSGCKEKQKVYGEACVSMLRQAFVEARPEYMLQVQTSIERSDDIVGYALHALAKLAGTQLQTAIANAVVYLLWCEAKLYDPLTDACEPSYVDHLKQVLVDSNLKFQLAPTLSPRLQSDNFWQFIETSPCPNKVATFVRHRVKCAIEMIRRTGCTVALKAWLPCVLVKPSLSMETPDYWDLLDDMQAILVIASDRVDYSHMLQSTTTHTNELCSRNIAVLARRLATHEVSQCFDFGSSICNVCARHLSLGGSLVDVLRRHTGPTDIRFLLREVVSQPLSDWAHLLPLLEEGKDRLQASLAEVAELSATFVAQCANSSPSDVDVALRVLHTLCQVELSPVHFWTLDFVEEASKFCYSTQLRRSLHALAEIIDTVWRVMPPEKTQRVWQRAFGVASCLLQRCLLHERVPNQRVLVPPVAVKQVHYLLWLLLLSGLTEVQQKRPPTTKAGAERALLLDMLLQLAQSVLTRVTQRSRALLLHVCDDVYGEGSIPVEIVDLVYAFVGDSRDNGLFAATASELMGSRFLCELVSHALCCLQQILQQMQIDMQPLEVSVDQLPAQFDLQLLPFPVDGVSGNFRVVHVGSEPYESLRLQIEHESPDRRNCN